MELINLKPIECKKWLLEKHYARRITPINKAFGLVINGYLQGVCTFAIPASRFNFSKQPYELNRLVVNENIGDDSTRPKNILSKFLSMCLNNFGESAIIVSYADENYGHHGYIYQATNWVYTGLSSAEKRIFVNNQELHRRTLYDKYGTSSLKSLRQKGLSVSFKNQLGKHRYFYFIGSKKDKRKFKTEVFSKYNILPYPKGDNTIYDAGKDIVFKLPKKTAKLF